MKRILIITVAVLLLFGCKKETSKIVRLDFSEKNLKYKITQYGSNPNTVEDVYSEYANPTTYEVVAEPGDKFQYELETYSPRTVTFTSDDMLIHMVVLERNIKISGYFIVE